MIKSFLILIMNLITNGEGIIFSNELKNEYFCAPSKECTYNLNPMNISLERYNTVYIVCDPVDFVDQPSSWWGFVSKTWKEEKLNNLKRVYAEFACRRIKTYIVTLSDDKEFKKYFPKESLLQPMSVNHEEVKDY